MKEYNCKKWSEVPTYLKTKTSLNNMGIYNLSKVCATVTIYNHTYNLYDLNECLRVERKRGNKSLMINSLTKSNYLIMEMTTTGSSDNDEILELTIIDLDGKLLYQNRFKPQVVKFKKYTYHFTTPMYLWKNEWNKIKDILNEKIILVPNTIYAKRLINQTCDKYKLEKLENLYLICSKPQIQHKLSILNILGKNKEEIQDNPKEVCFDFLKIIYPKAKIYYMRRKAEIYFDKLCEYKFKRGYQNAYKDGNDWLMKEYKINVLTETFNTFSYERCEDIINLIYPILKGLGTLPKRIE